MTDEQIIKAADICRTGECSGCPYHELYTASCLNKLTKDVYHLINRQKAENKQLTEALECANTRIKELTTKIECNDGFDQWKHLADVTEKHYEELYQEAKESVRAEAIKEFAERLKDMSIGLEIGDDKKYKMTVVSPLAIDTVLKEMTEVRG